MDVYLALIDQGLPSEGHLPAEIPDKHLLQPDATVHQLGELLIAYERL